MSRLVEVTDAQSNTSEIEYDLLGRKTKLIDPNMLDLVSGEPEWSYTYDDNGNLVEQEDPRGTVVEFFYDELNRVHKKEVVKDQGATVSPAFPIARWSYDRNGELGLLGKSVAYHDSEFDYDDVDYTITVDHDGYDTRDRVTKTIWTVDDGTADTYTVDYSYDPADRLVTVKYPTVGGSRETVTYSYQSRTGRPKDLDTDLSGADSMVVDDATWTASGQPDAYVLGSNSGEKVYRSWTYKAGSQRLSRIRAGTTSGGDDISHFRHFYDAVGNIDELSDENHGTGQHQCFSYDDLNRLQDAFTSDDCAGGYNPATGTGPYEFWYEYNSVGNVTKLRDTEAGTVLAAWYYGDTGVGAGAYAAHDWNPDPGAAVAIEYDGSGNMISRGADTLVFDADNRLGFYDTSTGTDTGMVYDVDGNRILRVHGASSTTYIGDVFESDGTTTTSYYSFAGDTVGFREHTTTSDTRFYVTGDHLGSTATVIDASDVGNPVDQYYYPYGEPRTSWSISIDRAYTGQTSDHAETGLYHYNARYYDPQIHRFISADTIIPNPANPQTLNRYSYVGNNPATYTDPTGNYLVGSDNYCSGCRRHYTYYSGPAGTLTYEYDHDGTRILPTTVDAAAPDPVGSSGLWGDIFAFAVFDIDACSSIISVSCGVEALGILPWGKAAKIARVLRYGDEFADTAKALPGRAVDDVAGAFCSFSAETEVLMADGTTKPISDIEVGEMVFAADPETGEEGPRQVTATWEHQDTLVELETSAGNITTTEDHPYWNHTDSEWQPADQLDPGDQLLTSTGQTITINGLDTTTTTGDAHNLTINDLHTYYVDIASDQVLVHNTCGRLFQNAGVDTSDHFLRNLAGREARGITERAALETYSSGRLFYDTRSGYYIRHSSRTQISVVVDAPSGGRAVSVFEGPINKAWNPVRWRPGL